MTMDTKQTNGSPVTNGSPTLEEKTILNRMDEVVNNIIYSRSQMIQSFSDPRRDISEECGWPQDNIFNADAYRQLYDRDPIANRVVQLMPKECWQVQFNVNEDDDPEVSTEFEEAWDDLNTSLRGEQCWFNGQDGSPINSLLKRADILSRIGHFGVVLLGFDDGKRLDQPVDGVVSLTPPTTNRKVRKDRDGNIVDNRSMPVEVEEAKQLGIQTINIPQVTSFAGAQGTDAQYIGVQLGPPEWPSTSRSNEDRELLFIRTFDESLVQIVQYEANIRNPRFGFPVMYMITLNDPREQHSGVGLPMSTVRVHWSRIVHLAESLISSEIFAAPAMRPVLNTLLDSQKVRGGSAEGYWKGALLTLSLETHPQLGGDVIVDKAANRQMMEDFYNRLRRSLTLTGMSAKSIAPAVVDPKSFIEALIEAICIQLGCPVRVFKGSERGELASSQDDSSWNDKIRERQKNYLIPKVIVPFIDRLISAGVLPEPKQGYWIEWPDLDSQTEKDKAQIALSKTQALAAYVAGGIEAMMPPADFYKLIMGMEDDKVKELLEDAIKHQEETMTIPPEGEEGHPATPPPPPPAPILPGGATKGPGAGATSAGTKGGGAIPKIGQDGAQARANAQSRAGQPKAATQQEGQTGE